jgi:hypothetical protein
MRREKDLIQKLLVKLEGIPAQPGDMFVFNGSEPELAIEGYSSDQVEYHLSLLKSEGYIDSPGSQPMLGVTFRSLTARGHDVVDQYRETKAAQESQRWISAAEAVRLLKPAFSSEFRATMTICERAHAGLIRARAERFMIDNQLAGEREVPSRFWWAEGHDALKQNWTTGDFETWIEQRTRLRAFGVSFLLADIEKMIPAAPVAEPRAPTVGGRPPADWWEDLLIDLCFKHFHGDLPHQKQADIVRVMQDWIAERGYDASESTIKLRARKLADAIKRDDAAGN